MLNTLLLSLALSPWVPNAVRVTPPADPPIRVWLNADGSFNRGDRAKVYVRAAENGFLVVLRADAQGRVRVLFPLDPGSDHAVRGGRKLEIKGRGDRTAFAVDDSTGKGFIIAVISQAPFRFEHYARGGRWDYRQLTAEPLGEDPESGLLSIVQHMAGQNPFDYDAVPYWVFSRYHEPPGDAVGHPYYPRWYSAYPFGLRSRVYSGFGGAYRDPFYYGPGYRLRPFRFGW